METAACDRPLQLWCFVYLTSLQSESKGHTVRLCISQRHYWCPVKLEVGTVPQVTPYWKLWRLKCYFRLIWFRSVGRPDMFFLEMLFNRRLLLQTIYKKKPKCFNLYLTIIIICKIKTKHIVICDCVLLIIWLFGNVYLWWYSSIIKQNIY